MRDRNGLPSPLLLGGIILIVIASLLGYSADGQFMATRGPSTLERMANVDTELAPHVPLQTELVPNLRYAVAFPENLTVSATHDFEVTAVVLSTRRYHRSRAARLAPIDLALAWGPLSNPVALSHLRLKQSHRVAQFRFDDGIGIDPDIVTASIANMHMIPINDAVRTQLLSISKGSVVTLTGALVHVTGPRGFAWKSSTSRTDTDGGACELMLVHSVTVHPAPLRPARTDPEPMAAL